MTPSIPLSPTICKVGYWMKEKILELQQVSTFRIFVFDISIYIFMLTWYVTRHISHPSYLKVGVLFCFLWHLIHLHGLLFLCNLVRQNTLGLKSLAMAGLCSRKKFTVWSNLPYKSCWSHLSTYLQLLIIPLHAFHRTDSCHFCCVHLMTKRRLNEWVSKKICQSAYAPLLHFLDESTMFLPASDPANCRSFLPFSILSPP